MGSGRRRYKHNTRRRADLGKDPRWFQPSIAVVDPTHQHRTRILIADREMFPRRLNSEMTRLLARCALLLGIGDGPLFAIHIEENHGVIAPVRNIEPLSRGMHADLRS